MKQDSRHPGSPPAEQRMIDLLADRALFGLDTDEEKELTTLMETLPDADHDRLDRIAAALAVHWIEPQTTAAPSLRRIVRRQRPLLTALVAVAASVIAVTAWPLLERKPEPHSETPRVADTFVRAREEMLDTVDDVIHLECHAITAADEVDSPNERARGDIVWSPSRQRGFLRIRGLPTNDPRQKQYQIWIIAGRRTVPISCGVFDVRFPSGSNADGMEVVVPILPQEFVQGAMTFAITTEKPGGADAYASERTQAVARAD